MTRKLSGKNPTNNHEDGIHLTKIRIQVSAKILVGEGKQLHTVRRFLSSCSLFTRPKNFPPFQNPKVHNSDHKFLPLDTPGLTQFTPSHPTALNFSVSPLRCLSITFRPNICTQFTFPPYAIHVPNFSNASTSTNFTVQSP
jgi:hypothetical protein